MKWCLWKRKFLCPAFSEVSPCCVTKGPWHSELGVWQPLLSLLAICEPKHILASPEEPCPSRATADAWQEADEAQYPPGRGKVWKGEWGFLAWLAFFMCCSARWFLGSDCPVEVYVCNNVDFHAASSRGATNNSYASQYWKALVTEADTNCSPLDASTTSLFSLAARVLPQHVWHITGEAWTGNHPFFQCFQVVVSNLDAFLWMTQC